MGERHGCGVFGDAICDAHVWSAETKYRRGKRVCVTDRGIRIDRANPVDDLDCELVFRGVEGGQEAPADALFPNWLCDILVRIHAAGAIHVLRIERLSELFDLRVSVADRGDIVPPARFACGRPGSHSLPTCRGRNVGRGSQCCRHSWTSGTLRNGAWRSKWSGWRMNLKFTCTVPALKTWT